MNKDGSIDPRPFNCLFPLRQHGLLVEHAVGSSTAAARDYSDKAGQLFGGCSSGE